ncbi:exocyst subunit [Elasticomyces elasticus]|nr:exocyst subunit [Elasticomyces elasticus]
MYDFLESLDTSVSMIEDTSRNPEANTFYYIQLLIESLNRMARLDVAIDSLEQRMPVELFRVVEKSHIEVDQRHPSAIRNNAKAAQAQVNYPNAGDGQRTLVLHDLLATLYAKLEAIAEGHRVAHDVISGISKREKFGDSGRLTRGFEELWKLYQSEIFKLAELDMRSTDLATEREDLEFILKASVPGLVSSGLQNSVKSAEDNIMPDRSATGHKLLVTPSVFNMAILLPPSLSFLTRLKDVVPRTADIEFSTLTAFLDDFLVNVFYPQLEETIVDQCAQAFVEADAFQEDPKWRLQSQKPIIKVRLSIPILHGRYLTLHTQGTLKFHTLIEAFCRMLDHLPHDQAFSQLILTQMRTYYDKCHDWYNVLVARGQLNSEAKRSPKMAAALADQGEVSDLAQRLSIAEGEDRQALIEQETTLLLKITSSRPIEDADVSFDRRSITGLCLLYSSLRWLAAKISKLRYISDHAVDSSRRSSRQNHHHRRWTIAGGPDPLSNTVYLPLNQETAAAFDAAVASYHRLAAVVLRTLHLEIRCRFIHGTTKALRAPYVLEQPYNDPDASILALNTDLIAFDETIAVHLQQRPYTYMTNGLAHLTDQALTQNAGLIQGMNSNGCNRMQLNVLVLQQNLKNIAADTSLARAARFYELFEQGPDAIIDAAQENLFPEDQLKVMMRLCVAARAGEARSGMQQALQRGLDEYLELLSSTYSKK